LRQLKLFDHKGLFDDPTKIYTEQEIRSVYNKRSTYWNECYESFMDMCRRTDHSAGFVDCRYAGIHFGCCNCRPHSLAHDHADACLERKVVSLLEDQQRKHRWHQHMAWLITEHYRRNPWSLLTKVLSNASGVGFAVSQGVVGPVKRTSSEYVSFSSSIKISLPPAPKSETIRSCVAALSERAALLEDLRLSLMVTSKCTTLTPLRQRY